MKYTLVLLVLASLLATCVGADGGGIIGDMARVMFQGLSEATTTAKDAANNCLSVLGKIVEAM